MINLQNKNSGIDSAQNYYIFKKKRDCLALKTRDHFTFTFPQISTNQTVPPKLLKRYNPPTSNYTYHRSCFVPETEGLRKKEPLTHLQ